MLDLSFIPQANASNSKCFSSKSTHHRWSKQLTFCSPSTHHPELKYSWIALWIKNCNCTGIYWNFLIGLRSWEWWVRWGEGKKGWEQGLTKNAALRMRGGALSAHTGKLTMLEINHANNETSNFEWFRPRGMRKLEEARRNALRWEFAFPRKQWDPKFWVIHAEGYEGAWGSTEKRAAMRVRILFYTRASLTPIQIPCFDEPSVNVCVSSFSELNLELLVTSCCLAYTTASNHRSVCPPSYAYKTTSTARRFDGDGCARFVLSPARSVCALVRISFKVSCAGVFW